MSDTNEQVEQPKRKKAARIPKLEGRVIEEAIINYTNPDETQPEMMGPMFELHVSGGITFQFYAVAKPISTRAKIALGRDRNGEWDGEWANVTENGIDYDY